jgi:head-tail adaptor
MYAAFLGQTCTISRCSGAIKDAWGQPTGAWADLATNVPCRLANERGQEYTDTERQVTVKLDRLFLRVGRDITERDRVTLDGATYEVLFVGRPASVGGRALLYADVKLVR